MRSPAAQRHVVFSLAIAALFLAAQLSSFTHLLLVKHVTCPEHGELIHADEAVAHSAPSNAPSVASATSRVWTHGHEHCLASTARREQALVPPSVAVLAQVTVPKDVVSEVRVAAPAPVALLRLAPKSSPPA